MKAKRQHSRKRSIVFLSIIAVLLAAFTVLTAVPFELGIRDYIPVVDNISLGIDLKGGVYVVMEASDKDEDGNPIESGAYEASLSGTISTLTNRLVAKGYTEATVVKQGANRIRIEIPDVENPDDVFNIIGKPAVLEFRDSNGTVLISGKNHLERAFFTYDDNNKPAVGLKFNDEGAEAFSRATADNVGKTISIYIDEELVSSPTVNQQISGGNAIITGNFTVQQALDMAMLLQSGTLPLTLDTLEKGNISPTLGQNALRNGIIAGIIGLVLVMAFMCAFYRGIGLISSITLFIYTLLMLYVIAGMPLFFSLAIIPKAQLTLPGIAGIILSMGMAIDANIIIAERIKDEYKIGKSLDSSINVGFKRSLWTILDGNITTLFAGIVLLIFGTGSIKGFANVLIIGIVLAVFCGLVVTRLLMKIFLGLTQSASFYGLRREEEITPRWIFKKDFKVVESKKTTFTASLAVIVVGILVSIIFGLNLGLDFTGGNIITARIGSELNQGGNFDTLVGTINSTIDDFARENGLDIERGTAQLIGSDSQSGITLRYRIKNNLSNAELFEKNEELNDLIEERLEQKIEELGISKANFNFEEPTAIGSVVSGEMVSSALLSIAITVALMLIYLAFRFEWQMGVASVIALLHDALVMFAFVAIFRYPINSSFIAAILTILGYSINATIVVFDRVRENTKRLTLRQASDAEIGNISIKETLTRSINTTITTLITIVMLFAISGSDIREFAFPIIVGLITGTYSSVLLSVPMWTMLKHWTGEIKKKLEEKKALSPKTPKAQKT